jgi:hypothetical protein
MLMFRVHFPYCFYAGKNTHVVGTVHGFQYARYHIIILMFLRITGQRIMEKTVGGFKNIACF